MNTALVGAVVEIVRVDSSALPLAPLRTLILVGLRLRIGTTVVPGGVVVKTAVSATLPVKPPTGITEMYTVPLAPRLTVMLLLSVRVLLLREASEKPTAAVAVPLNVIL